MESYCIYSLEVLEIGTSNLQNLDVLTYSNSPFLSNSSLYSNPIDHLFTSIGGPLALSG
jgi:hypothetical protein